MEENDSVKRKKRLDQTKIIEMKLKLFLLTSILMLQNCNEGITKTSTRSKTNEPILLSRTDTLNDADTALYQIVEKMPMWLGCEFEEDPKGCSKQKFMTYIYGNIKYNPISRNDNLESMIWCTFVIEKNGTTSNIEIKKGSGLSNIKEVISKMTLWNPGEHHGLKKRVQMSLPIRINWE